MIFEQSIHRFKMFFKIYSTTPPRAGHSYSSLNFSLKCRHSIGTFSAAIVELFALFDSFIQNIIISSGYISIRIFLASVFPLPITQKQTNGHQISQLDCSWLSAFESLRIMCICPQLNTRCTEYISV